MSLLSRQELEALALRLTGAVERVEALCDRADRITPQSGPTAMLSVVKTAGVRAALDGE